MENFVIPRMPIRGMYVYIYIGIYMCRKFITRSTQKILRSRLKKKDLVIWEISTNLGYAMFCNFLKLP